MASINEKLNYINETKSLIKDKLNDLGSEIEDETTFREYAEKIEDLYDEWPKISDEDTTITLNNTKKGKMNLQLKGNLNQFTIIKKNLLNNILKSGVYNGITYTVNADKSVTLSGTATAITWLILNNSITLEAGTYTMSQNYINNDIRMYCGALSGYVNNGIRTQTINETKTSDISINIPSGTVISTPITLYPMVEKGSSATQYQPYVDESIPNPDYPQDIEVVTGENTINITNYNLLDFSGVSQESKVTVNDDGTVTLNGTGGFSLNFKEINIVQGTTYSTFVELINGTITGSPMNGTGLMSPLGKGNWLSNNIQDIYTPNENKKRHSIWVGDQGTYNNATFRIWTYIGNTILPFQPYQIQMCPINLGTLELCKINDFQDYLYKQNNTWFKKPIILKINNYNEETITTDYISTTGSLTPGATVYYINPNSNPNGIEIADTILINQLNILEQTTSYDNQTNIWQINDNLSFVITANALLKNSN